MDKNLSSLDITGRSEYIAQQNLKPSDSEVAKN